jgi:cobalt/nickel transport system permease protein
MPDYNFAPAESPAADNPADTEEAWPAVDPGTSTAGVLGGLGTLLLVVTVAYLLRPRARAPE